MKKFLVVALLLVLLGGGLLFAMSKGSLTSGLMGLVLDEDEKQLFELAKGFLEAIQYKDFSTAAGFHNEDDEKKVDIPKMIESLFKVKPEVLNIRDLKVTRVTVDSTGKRARTFFDSNIEFLNSLQRKQDKDRKNKNVEGVLYWQKEKGQWQLKLESSLRGLRVPK